MKTTIQSVGRFFKSEDGPTSVEYCFMIGFILLVCIAAIGTVGDATLPSYQEPRAEITK